MKSLTLIFLVLASAANAGIIRVYNHPDSTFNTIQSGINAAIPGDTVLVSDCVYYEQVNFNGKRNLMVASNFIIDGDPIHIYNTVIDGSRLPYGDASVVKFFNGTDTTSVLAGFTIRNGRGCFAANYIVGGGIYIKNSGAKVVNNRIMLNRVNGDTLGSFLNARGGGIGTNHILDTHWIIIRDNIIKDNSCLSNSLNAYGAGVYSSFNTIFEGNTVSANICSSSLTATAQGGGLAMEALPGSPIPITMYCRWNRLIHNKAESVTGPAYGGGFSAMHVKVILSGNELIENSASSYFSGQGGGAYAGDLQTESLISKNLFQNNSSGVYGGALYIESDDVSAVIENNNFNGNKADNAGAIYSEDIALMFINNVFHENTAKTGMGGALYMNRSGSPSTNARFVNNSFSENSAMLKGGAVVSANCNPLFLNTIFWQNTSATGQDIDISSGNATIAYSDIDITRVEGVMEMLDGTFSQDPAFCMNQYRMPSGNSPCLDAGTAQFIFPGQDTLNAPLYDILGTPRPLNNQFDLGAYEVLITGNPENEFDTPVCIYPNPFSGRLYCQYRLQRKSEVTITMYDITGRIMGSIHSVQLSGENNSLVDIPVDRKGVYVLKIQLDKEIIVRKVIKN